MTSCEGVLRILKAQYRLGKVAHHIIILEVKKKLLQSYPETDIFNAEIYFSPLPLLFKHSNNYLIIKKILNMRRSNQQGDQLNMTCVFLYFVKRDLFSMLLYTYTPDKSLLQGTRKIRPCLTGHPV